MNAKDSGVPCTLDSTRVPVEYYKRFSLCVLDVIRILQQTSIFAKGVEKCHIVGYIRHLPCMDGDISVQVATALRHLETAGYVLHLKTGYKTLGPLAKLSLTRTQKQRRVIWRKLNSKFNLCNDDVALPSCQRKSTRSMSDSDIQINESRTTLNSLEPDDY